MNARKPADKPDVVHIVDDDTSVRRALTRLVESMGIRAEAYASPEEILERAREAACDCLLLDVQLPRMDGFELHDRLLEEGRAAPVIFISAHPTADTRARAAAAHAVAFLEKPFDEELLFAAIRRALDR